MRSLEENRQRQNQLQSFIDSTERAMRDAPGMRESFSALVSSVVKSGLFVECENLVEGFVPASAFPGCRIDEESMTLAVGKAVYRPGTPIEVRLVEADVGTRRITFEVA